MPSTIAQPDAALPCVGPSQAAPPVPLSSLRPGQTAVIAQAGLEADDAALLRAMGLCVRATVRMFRAGEPCVIAVGGVSTHCKCGGMCRIGLARSLADRILVSVRP